MTTPLIASTEALRNVARNMLRPGYFGEMKRKLFLRVKDRDYADEVVQATNWCKEKSESAEKWGKSLDAKLWKEAEGFAKNQSPQVEKKLQELRDVGVDMGGGGHYTLLYFYIRLNKPEYVVETGVAAGFSSRAILVALSKNGSGQLLSSDFPCFRLDNPEQYIGALVEDELRENWTLLTKGDRVNIPKIVEQCGPIELFHYDSDKSRDGRNFVLDQIAPKLTNKSIIIIDDIHNNMHFADYVEANKLNYKVFPFERKWVGLILPSESK